MRKEISYLRNLENLRWLKYSELLEIMVGHYFHKNIRIESSMGKVRDWETYLDDTHEESNHQKIRKFKDSENKPQKKRRKA